MKTPKCGHKPDPGFRELFGEELEAHLKNMEQSGFLSRTPHTYRETRSATDTQETCLHVYVKIEPK